MFPASIWRDALELGSISPLFLRAHIRPGLKDVIAILPQVPKLWHRRVGAIDFRRDRAYHREKQIWASEPTIHHDQLRFWTPAEMAQLEQSYAARKPHLQPSSLLVPQGPDDYLPFATELLVQMDLAGTTLNNPHAHASAAAAGPGHEAASRVVNPFDSLPDTHCLFEIWHCWQFAFGTGPPLRFAHVKGAEMYGFLEEENRNADGSFPRWDDYLLVKGRCAVEGEGGVIVGESSDDEGSIQSWEEREGEEGSDDDDEWI
jgi:hypothetical protein